MATYHVTSDDLIPLLRTSGLSLQFRIIEVLNFF